MLRVSDPAKSLAFYRDTMGMTLVDKLDFPQWKFSLYFLQTLPKSAAYLLEPGSEAAHAHLWSTNGVTLEARALASDVFLGARSEHAPSLCVLPAADAQPRLERGIQRRKRAGRRLRVSCPTPKRTICEAPR